MAGGASLSAGFQSAGAAVNSIFGGKAAKEMAGGYRASGQSYLTAAELAQKSAEISKQSTELQLESADRQIYKTLGGQAADVAGAGLKASGSALDLMRDSTAQGELTMSLIELQGELNVAGYEAQAEMYKGQAALAFSQAASSEQQAKGSMISGIIHGASSLMSFGMV